MFENKVCDVSYIVLSFMFIIIGCCIILCYIFMFVIVMFMGGIYYKLFSLFSMLLPNMYISLCMTCLYVYKLEKLGPSSLSSNYIYIDVCIK